VFAQKLCRSFNASQSASLRLRPIQERYTIFGKEDRDAVARFVQTYRAVVDASAVPILGSKPPTCSPGHFLPKSSRVGKWMSTMSARHVLHTQQRARQPYVVYLCCCACSLSVFLQCTTCVLQILSLVDKGELQKCLGVETAEELAVKVVARARKGEYFMIHRFLSEASEDHPFLCELYRRQADDGIGSRGLGRDLKCASNSVMFVNLLTPEPKKPWQCSYTKVHCDPASARYVPAVRISVGLTPELNHGLSRRAQERCVCCEHRWHEDPHPGRQ
jgi:hypothetical protein